MKQNKFLIVFFLFLVALITLFLRLFNLRQTFLFVGDQGRDAMRVSQIWQELNPPLIGPVTSMGNMYLPPWYYYLMAPALFLTYPDPLGPGLMVVILSSCGVMLVYFLGKKIFGSLVSLIATFLMSVSFLSLTYSRFSWNPNLAPLFSLLVFYFVFLAFKKKQPKFYGWAFFFLGWLLSCHYVALLSLLTVLILMIIDFYHYLGQKKMSQFWHWLIICGLILVLFFAPIFIFDLKHQGLNNKAWLSFFTKETAFGQDKVWMARWQQASREIRGRSLHVGYELVFGKIKSLPERYFAGLLILIVLFTLLLQIKNRSLGLPVKILLLFLFVGVMGLSFFQGSVYDHYLLYLLPLVFYAWGLTLNYWWNKNSWGQFCVMLFIGFYFYCNVNQWPLIGMDWTMDKVKKVSESVYQKIYTNDYYDLILISESKDWFGQNYRYFFSTYSNKPTSFAQRDKINKMIIIDETKQGLSALDPVPEWQVFGSKKILETWKPLNDGPMIYILVK